MCFRLMLLRSVDSFTLSYMHKSFVTGDLCIYITPNPCNLLVAFGSHSHLATATATATATKPPYTGRDIRKGHLEYLAIFLIMLGT